ncbi:MAG TPA: hypothetical protein VHP36_01160 [Chitinispirillaceae bacterium]|nr:hypothetical protein [Chitinispirillaceae bacterium]
MLSSANDLLGYSIKGIDDYIGPVMDLYIDDWQWIIRYLVVEISENQQSVKYLISPDSVGKINHISKEISVALTLSKIKNSPEFLTNLPISRQYELALRRYYEWPEYWQQTSFSDPPPAGIVQKDEITLDESGKPVEQQPLTPDSEEILSDTTEKVIPDEPDDQQIIEAEFGLPEEQAQFSIELRSFMDLKGYRIQTTDSDNSALENLIIDETDWSTKYFVVNLHDSSENQLILLTLHFVQQIDWGTNRIFITLTQQQLQDAPRFYALKPITIDFEKKVYAYFDSL